MNIIEIKKQHIPAAAKVLTLAFENDHIFRYIFKTREEYFDKAPWLFSAWVKWAIRYGKAWISDDHSSVVLMRAIGNSDMSFWSTVRTGMIATPFKIGLSAFRRLQLGVVPIVEQKHKEIIGDKPHWYGWMLGSDPAKKGGGLKLISFCTRIADEAGMPLFLETSLERNALLYCKYAKFELKDKVPFPHDDFTVFFLVRPPQNKNDSLNKEEMPGAKLYGNTVTS